MAKIIKSVDCPEVKHPAGAVLFEEGATSNCFYIVKAGQVDVFRNHGKVDQFLLATLGVGRVLGEISCLDDGPRTATAVAREDVQLVCVSAKTLKWQLAQCPSWFGAVILDIVERLRLTDDLVPTSKVGS